MKLYRFKFLTAETLGRMGTSVDRSDFWEILGGQALVDVSSMIFKEAVNQSQVTLVQRL